MWLLQLPKLLDATESERLQHTLQGATHDRMLREMAAFIESLTVDRMLVLMLEDLHWSDTSTLSLITYLARRREAARVLIVGTYRPAEITRRKHSLRSIVQELAQSRHCRELPLTGWSEREVSEYVTSRFPGKALPATLSNTVYRYTEGNPLFVVNMVAHLVSQRLIAPRNGRWTWQKQESQFHWGIPDTLRHVIEGQLDGLSQEEQRLLKVGSVAGMEFSAAVVAAALGEDLISVEECCDMLVRHHLFLGVAGTRAEQERRLATRYRFLHSLYLNVIYERLPQAKRRQLHLSIGEQKERAYGARAAEVAAELAVHFEEGRDYPRTVQYLKLAAKTAMQRHAPQEARTHLQQALTLLARLPASPELDNQLHEVQRALQHPLLSLANAEARNVRYPRLSQTKLRKIA